MRKYNKLLVGTFVVASLCVIGVVTTLHQRSLDAATRESLIEYRNWIAKSWKLDGPLKSSIRLFIATPPQSVFRLLQRRDTAIENLGGTMFGVLCYHLEDEALKNELFDMQFNGNIQEMRFANNAIAAMTLEQDGSYKWQHVIEEMTGSKAFPASPFGSWGTTLDRLQ